MVGGHDTGADDREGGDHRDTGGESQRAGRGQAQTGAAGIGLPPVARWCHSAEFLRVVLSGAATG
jgi:hypothetical protein